nr:hypothetical protein CFP56_44085 [Quercus suber]
MLQTGLAKFTKYAMTVNMSFAMIVCSVLISVFGFFDLKHLVFIVLRMAAANTGQIDHAQLGPINRSVLRQQPDHRSEVIWNGQDPGSFTCRGHSEEFSNREPRVDD